MKKLYTTIALILIIGFSVSQAQTVTDSWAFGFGASFPRFYSVNIRSLNTVYGGYLSIQRNFSEHVGLRLKGGYSHFEGQWNNTFLQPVTESTNLITGDLDMLYYFVPCEPVSPYLFAGVGLNYKDITNGQTVMPDDNKLGSQLNIGAGAEFRLGTNWNLVTEFGYHMTNNSELDGAIAPIEVNGRDSYIVLSAGLNFFFGKGEPSKQCEACEGITMEMKDMTDYKKIEDMIIAHIPKEVTKEVVVEKQTPVVSNNWVLVGVNFAFNKSTLLPEAYPILYNAAELLLLNPDTKVEIQGYCDYIGSDKYNDELSLKRAETVKMFLISKGVAKTNLTTKGFGRSNPVADNKTDEGRAMNRRIEFKVIK